MISSLMILAEAGTTGQTQSGGMGIGFMIAYIVIFAGLIYLLFVKPQKKQNQQQETMMKGLKPGDSIMTTSGFYGTVIGIDEDTVIVEFGNNKNCRIPMHKKAIADVESADAVEEEPEEVEEETNSKLGKKKK
ncbi:protein translocase subunit yajC [Lachnospiraceae bacterium]|nr:protein translocase subunit yajC [Lachnospiraceae bacterium]